MNLNKHIKDSVKIVDKALDQFLPKDNKKPRILHKAMRYSVFSGGKRIRPVLVLESAKACKCARHKDALVAACAVELIHAYSLIHDDLPCMDNDDYRRGKPTCHKVFGEANAILAGDALLTLAFNILAKSLDPRAASAAIRELSEAMGSLGMVGGQVMDIGYKGKKTCGKLLNTINTLKSAKLFEVSARLGAIVAGADLKRQRAMATYGSSMGLAFQIADDIIDGEGYAQAFGAEKARRDCEALILEAKAALVIFGQRAFKLKEIADYIASRRR